MVEEVLRSYELFRFFISLKDYIRFVGSVKLHVISIDAGSHFSVSGSHFNATNKQI